MQMLFGSISLDVVTKDYSMDKYFIKQMVSSLYPSVTKCCSVPVPKGVLTYSWCACRFAYQTFNFLTMLLQGMTKTVRILLFVNIWTTFLDTNITEKVMDEVETVDLNPLGYTFHSQPLVIPVKGRNLVHRSDSYTINEASKVIKVHQRYEHDKLFEITRNMKSDYCFSVLNPSTLKTIRRYRLNM